MSSIYLPIFFTSTGYPGRTPQREIITYDITYYFAIEVQLCAIAQINMQ